VLVTLIEAYESGLARRAPRVGVEVFQSKPLVPHPESPDANCLQGSALPDAPADLDKGAGATHQIRARRQNSNLEVASVVSPIAIIGAGVEKPCSKGSEHDRHDEG